MNIQCLKCKGRNFCSRPVCPIIYKISAQKKLNPSLKQDFFGASLNIFIGRFGYPNINVGILGTEDYNHHDEPLYWSAENYQIQNIIDLRTSLVNSSFKTNIKSFKKKFIDISQEISMASKPVDVEVNLAKKPSFRLSFNQDTMPHGPRVKLKKAELAENPKIPTAVDKAVSDIDLKANEAINLLYKKNFDEHYLTKLLSVGNLGIKKQRKLVPTRWSITCVDDLIGKKLIQEIKDYSETNYLAYFGGYLGNYYLILFFPEIWTYELFETYVGSADYQWPFATDYENYYGRKLYAHSTAGGYYASRLSTLEKLSKLKKQGSVLALRFITNDYWAPVGVWVVREATRNALKSKPIEFSSKELMLEYARKLIKKKFNYDVNNIINKSILLKEIKTQKKLKMYL